MLTSDSYRTGTTDTPICDCGHAWETTEHFLLHCNRYEKERKDMFDFIYQSGITTKQNTYLLYLLTYKINALALAIVTLTLVDEYDWFNKLTPAHH